MDKIFFQIFLALLGIVIGILSQVVQPRVQKWMLFIFGLLLFLFAGLWGGYRLATKELAPTQISPTASSNLTSTQAQTTEVSPTSITASVTQTSPSVIDWPLGNLIFQEDFETLPVMKGWNINGSFQRVSDETGNHLWQTSTNSQAYFTLPVSGSDYAMEARVMQVSGGQAFPILAIRYTNGSPCESDYRTYFDTSLGWLTLTEFGLTASGTCDELRVGGTGLIAGQRIPLSNNTWYKLRIEAKGAEIRAYLNDQFMLQGVSNPLHSNQVTIFAYSSGNPFVFDFDDIKIWSLAP